MNRPSQGDSTAARPGDSSANSAAAGGSRLNPAPAQARSPSGSGAMGASFWRAKNPLGSFRHAVEGVVHTFRTQRNMRFHFVTVALVLLSGLLFRLTRVEMLVLLFTSTLVLIAEMFNTAIEVVVDMITQSYHPAAKYAKDVAAGAVLIAAINAVVVGCVLFLWDGRPEMLRVRLQQPAAFHVVITGMLLLLILLVVGKVLGEKGTLLQGGVVSGHSAIAFFLATTILFFANNVFVAVLALLLALLVAQSRVEAHIHTVQEVLVGAALGLLLTAIIYALPAWFGRHVLPTRPTGISQRESTPAVMVLYKSLRPGDKGRVVLIRRWIGQTRPEVARVPRESGRDTVFG